MGTGLIIGKFMPLHRGHMGLIDFAARRSRRLIILLAGREHEPIPGDLRLQWLRETCGGNENIRIEFTGEPLPDSPVSSREVSRVWAAYLAERFPETDTLFSSEKYGEYLAEYMGIEHVFYDPERSEFPVSGSRIREEPCLYWEYIPEAVRPYYLKKVCLYGPESTGKSTLASRLAEFYGTVHVPEMAREILGNRHVVFEDIPVIAETHAREIGRKEKVAERILFVDTDLITTRIYSEHYFGSVPPFPGWVESVNSFHLYLFCEIDTRWIEDPQRDLGHRREEFRGRFIEALAPVKAPSVRLWGDWEERFRRAREAVESMWNFPPHITGKSC